MPERTWHTLKESSLDHDSLPMRLWHKAKKLGTWDPLDLDFTRDVQDWQAMTGLEQEVLLHLIAQFQAGEESVAQDLLPLLLVVSREGRLEEEMFLASFLWEEAKHIEAFRRFLDEVVVQHGDLTRFHSPSYRTIFYQELPTAMERLLHDPTPEAVAEASVTYNMIVEGVLAETAYHALHVMLTENGLMPGMQQLATYLKRDESRHIAYGVFLLSRLVAEHGEPVWQAIQGRMNALLVPSLAMIGELFGAYEELPFGLEESLFVEYALSQYQRRMRRIERARSQTLEEVLRQDEALTTG